MKTAFQNQARADAVAIALSSLCLLHCLLLPLLLLMLPALAIALHDGPVWAHWIHWGLLATALPVSGFALWQGLARHGRFLPLGLAVVGFSVMFLGAMAHHAAIISPALIVSGGLVVAFGHWHNWRAGGQSCASHAG